jgi:hypothetical protein
MQYIAALNLTTVTKLTQISIFTHSNHAASTALATGLRRAGGLASDDFWSGTFRESTRDLRILRRRLLLAREPNWTGYLSRFWSWGTADPR